MNMFDQHDQDLLKQHRSLTVEQLTDEEQRRKLQREQEALTTRIETDAERADTEEYPIEEEN